MFLHSYFWFLRSFTYSVRKDFKLYIILPWLIFQSIYPNNASQFTCLPSLVFSCHVLITIKTEAYMDWPGRSILAWYVTNVSVEIFFCSKNQTLIFCWKTCSMKHSSLDGQCLNIEKKQIWSRSNQLVFFCDEFVTIWVVHSTFFICVTQLL